MINLSISLIDLGVIASSCPRQRAASEAIILVVPDDAVKVQPRFRLHAKHKPKLLLAMMRTLADEDAIISFEGQLSYTGLSQIAGASFSETPVLKRNTNSPRMDFVVLPLTPTTVAAIENAVASKIAFKGYAGIVHVQVERQGRLAFAAYDQFHEDCVWVSSEVSASILAELVGLRRHLGSNRMDFSNG